MPIENRDLPHGARLVASYKKQTYVCTVTKAEDGKLSFAVEGKDKSFNSPSSAASAIIGTAANGWHFWSLEGGATAASEKPAKTAKPAKTRKVDQFNAEMAAANAIVDAKATRKANTKASPLFKAMPPAADQTAGTARFWCQACQDSFDSEADKPEACANGHRADDLELNAPPAPEAVA